MGSPCEALDGGVEGVGGVVDGLAVNNVRRRPDELSRCGTYILVIITNMYVVGPTS